MPAEGGLLVRGEGPARDAAAAGASGSPGPGFGFKPPAEAALESRPPRARTNTNSAAGGRRWVERDAGRGANILVESGPARTLSIGDGCLEEWAGPMGAPSLPRPRDDGLGPGGGPWVGQLRGLAFRLGRLAATSGVSSEVAGGSSSGRDALLAPPEHDK